MAAEQLQMAALAPQFLAHPLAPTAFVAPVQGHAFVDQQQLRVGLAQAPGEVLVFASAQGFVEATDPFEPAATHQQVGTGQPLHPMQEA
ncbi:hypothetical protein D3C78_1580670 [compost metagenome]